MATGRRWAITAKAEGRETWENGTWEFMGELPVRFCIFQKERGGETGYEHFQMYLETDEPIRPGRIKKALGKDVHIEKAIADAESNIAYCSKDDCRTAGPWQKGTDSASSKKRVWTVLQDESRSTRDVVDELGYDVLMFDRIQRIRHAIRMDNNRNCERKRPIIHVLHGPPQCGKTSLVKRLLKDVPKHEQFWASIDEKTFWSDYHGQKHLIIDEGDKDGPGTALSSGCILRMLDDTPLIINVKYGHAYFTSEHVWFIGNRPIWEQFLEPSVQDSLKLRIADHGETIYITKDNRHALPTEIWCPTPAPPTESPPPPPCDD